MITLQKHIRYAGNVATAPLPTVALAFDFPIYKFTSTDGNTPTVTRQDTGSVVTWSVSQPLTDTDYQLTPGNGAVTGNDDTSSGYVQQYYMNALRTGAVPDAAIPVNVRFSVSGGIQLGGQTLHTLCLPKVNIRPALVTEVVKGATTPLDYILINYQAFESLKQRVAAASLKVPDNLVLIVISALTIFDSGMPSLSDALSTDIKGLLESAGTKVTNADANQLIQLIKEASGALFDFELIIPEMRTLDIGGTFTVLKSGGQLPVVADFQKFEIVAEFTYYGQETTPRRLPFRFGDGVTIINDAAAFSLASGAALLRTAVQDPVRILVKGLDSAVVWHDEYAVTDPVLAQLAIKVQAQDAAVLNGVPANAEPDSSRKLRGQVLTFKKECILTGALVLIQAKAKGDADWHIVGAGTTDGSGNFTIPYPYGAYTDARAVVSLSPAEAAPITVHQDGTNVTISNDFLYLLLKEPECRVLTNGEECDCEDKDVANRLPDHADLIGSDAYSQDIGGSCVNLSKPNRTINEYAYQAIVRTSDPDVANYTLTRYETGLEAIDVHLLASISSGAGSLGAATATALANATSIYNIDETVFADHYLTAIKTVVIHVNVIQAAVAAGAPPLTLTALATLQHHIDSVTAVLDAYKSMADANDEPLIDGGGAKVLEAAAAMKDQVALALDTVGTAVRYELTGGTLTRVRKPITLDNPVLWQDAPEPLVPTAQITSPMGMAVLLAGYANVRWEGKFGGTTLTPQASLPVGQPAATLVQAVSVATGHVLHYRAVVKADGYSLGDLIYSLPLAPGQKKEIVVFDASHSLVGAETQALTQNERLAMGLTSERDITDQLAGSISESMRGSSTADTRGVSAGFGTGGQGYGGTATYGGSGSAVIGVAGGWAQASSNAQQNSSRDVAQFFGESLRESIMQNAEGFRRLNASVVTTVQEGQRYGVTSEVVANHNHCHALTMMYFEVLRHFAVFQELASVEECVFIPLLLTRFTTENVGKWRDVLAPALLPMPSDTYLQPQAFTPSVGRQHPLLKAFDADQRIRTQYANVDFPAGSYDEERIQYIKGTVRLRINLPRPRTRFDRILSFPVVKQLDTSALVTAGAKFAQDSASYAAKAALTAGIYTLFDPPHTNPPNPEQFEVLAREAIFDAFMRLDATYQTVPPAQCMRIVDFTPKPVSVMSSLFMTPSGPLTELDFFAENSDDKKQWQQYSDILGYPDVAHMLNAHFKGNLISEWDTIFQQDIAPLVFEKILDAIQLDQFSTDFSSAMKYHSGERVMDLDLLGTTPKSRNQLPILLNMSVSQPSIRKLKNYVTLYVESASIGYSTAHLNGTLFNGPVRNDLLDGVALTIPENSEDKRNPRREDRYLAAKLIEHLNSNIEYYNKVLWYHLDPDRRYMLLDGFSIQVYDDQGNPLPGPGGFRSLASVVKNEVIAVAGNALVMAVAPGYKVSGSFISVTRAGEKTPTLLDHYQPLTPVPPYRISVPSKGVFAEAVQGVCNACEKIETERLQDWSRYPIGDEPPAINAVNVPTPAVTDWQAAFKDFAAPIVNVQNAPGAPAPGAGLAGLSELLGKAGVFKDITGLDANQQNAIKTYLSDQENAKAFAEMAKEMAMQQHNTANSGKIMDSIAQAKSSGDISKQEAGDLVKQHLQQQIDGGMSKKAELEAGKEASTPSLGRAAVDAASQGRAVKAQKADSAGNSESVDIGGSEVASTTGVVGGMETRKGLLPKGVTDDEKVKKVLELFGDAPIASAGDANTLFGAIGTGNTSTYLAWLRSRAESLGMDRAKGFQLWKQGDATGKNVKLFNFNYTPAAEANFTRLWDGIPTMYEPQGAINLIEFLALDLATHIEGYGDYTVVEEAVREGWGLDYFFEAHWVTPKGKLIQKRSYNIPPNKTARDLFADAVFRNAHDDLLPAGPTAWNTADAAWAGSNYGATKAPTSVTSDETAFIRQADFYKFRGRGYIQTTWRDNYRHLARALRAEIDSLPAPMWGIVSTWPAAGATEADFDGALSESRDDDWTNLFRSTGGIVPWLGVRTFSRAYSDCIHIAPPTAGSLLGNAAGHVEFLGNTINGYGGALAEAVRRVLLEMYDSLT